MSMKKARSSNVRSSLTGHKKITNVYSIVKVNIIITLLINITFYVFNSCFRSFMVMLSPADKWCINMIAKTHVNICTLKTFIFFLEIKLGYGV